VTYSTNYLDRLHCHLEVYVSAVLSEEGRSLLRSRLASSLEHSYYRTSEWSTGGSYSASDGAPCDLDGDGQLDLILKWIRPIRKTLRRAASQMIASSTDQVDGTRLWRIDLGVNIRAGAHDTQMSAYDLTATASANWPSRLAGTKDGKGNS